MKECYAYTDLEWRLAQIPDGAGCRGVYLNMVDERAQEFGRDVLREYRSFFKLYRFSSFRLYPVKDYLCRMVKLAQLKFGGPNIYRGLFELHAASWPAWRKTLIGRTTLGILGTDFHRILMMSRKTVEKSINYGSFDVQGGPSHYEAQFRNEYVYIEHAMAGGITGLARVCNVNLEIRPELTDPFNGKLHLDVIRSAVQAVQ
jgi:hypothetical protein